jgi:hypothetical protein
MDKFYIIKMKYNAIFKMTMMKYCFSFSLQQLICSYLFWPIVFLMGVAPEDCRVVARLVGIKTFVNEFLAYEDLGNVRRNRINLIKYLSGGYISGNQVGNGITNNWSNISLQNSTVNTQFNNLFTNGSVNGWSSNGYDEVVLQGTNITLKGGIISVSVHP